MTKETVKCKLFLSFMNISVSVMWTSITWTLLSKRIVSYDVLTKLFNLLIRIVWVEPRKINILTILRSFPVYIVSYCFFKIN